MNRGTTENRTSPAASTIRNRRPEQTSPRVVFVGRRANGEGLAKLVAENAELQRMVTLVPGAWQRDRDASRLGVRPLSPAGSRPDRSGQGVDGEALDGPEGGAPQYGLDTPTPIELVILTNQKSVLQEVRVAPPRLMMVEVDAKPDSRVRFCRMIRERLPLVMMMAVGGDLQENSFDFDGHLRLPWQTAQLQDVFARVRDELAAYVVQRGPIRLNIASRIVYTPNGQHHMTPKQAALLELLMARANEVVSRNEIMQVIWETSYMDDTRTLDVHIRWLRECIEPDPSTPVYLITARGQGYMLQI